MASVITVSLEVWICFYLYDLRLELDGHILEDGSWNLIMTDFQIWDNDGNNLEEEHLRIVDLPFWQFDFLELKKGNCCSGPKSDEQGKIIC